MNNRSKNEPNISSLTPVNQYYHDSNLVVPSLSHSIFMRASQGFMAPTFGMAAALKLTSPEEAKSYQLFKDIVENDESSPLESNFQSGSAHVASFAASLVNPITLGTAAVGEATALFGGANLFKYLPQSIKNKAVQPIESFFKEGVERFLPTVKSGDKKVVASMVDIGKRKLQTFGIGSGAAIPIELEENFDTKNNTINYSGVVKGTATAGGIALALDSIPYFYGVIRGKVKKAVGDSAAEELESMPVHNLDERLNELHQQGVLSKPELEWYKEYRSNPQNEESLSEKAAHQLWTDGHKVDTAKRKVMHEVFSPEDMKNYNISIVDQMAANLREDGSAMSDFISGSKLDEMRANPMSDGIDGVIDSIERKLANKENAAKKIDDLVEKYGTRNERRLRPFSQENLHSHMLKNGIAHEEMPLVVPDNVVSHMKISNKISRLEASNKELLKQKNKSSRIPEQKKFQNKIDSNSKQIQKLTDKKPKLMSVKEELKNIEESLVKDGKVNDNYQHGKLYHRLLDLSSIQSGARSLLYKINTMHEYQKQEAYRDVLKFFSNVMKTNFNKLADPKKMISYFKNRIDDKLPIEVKSEMTMAKVEKDVREIPADINKALDDQKTILKERGAKHLVKEYEKSANKAKEFNNSQNILKNLISCVMGTMNV